MNDNSLFVFTSENIFVSIFNNIIHQFIETNGASRYESNLIFFQIVGPDQCFGPLFIPLFTRRLWMIGLLEQKDIQKLNSNHYKFLISQRKTISIQKIRKILLLNHLELQTAWIQQFRLVWNTVRIDWNSVRNFAVHLDWKRLCLSLDSMS